MLMSSRDATTPSEDFVVSAHTHSKNLYIATAGSFHGWKFLPIIGKYVVNMLDGILDPVLAKTWAWDRELDVIPEGDMWPAREMKDLE
jgi:sarcosine oxidase/L-pipecolate oxidase